MALLIYCFLPYCSIHLYFHIHIKKHKIFFLPFFLFYTFHPCAYFLTDFSIMLFIFPLSPHLPW